MLADPDFSGGAQHLFHSDDDHPSWGWSTGGKSPGRRLQLLTNIMTIETDRPTARVVRLADLEREFPRERRPQVSLGLGSVEASDRLDRAFSGAPVEPLRPPISQSDWIGLPPTSRRAPHPIGSTLPGPLSEAEWPPSSQLPPDHHVNLRPTASRVRAPQPVRDVPRLPQGVVLRFPVRFDATGEAYARIWLSNLLLLVLTLGLAWPWTFRRRERFFLRHTQVAGHRLDFRLSARALWPRMAMTVALCLGVAGAVVGSVWTGLAALSLAALVWPLLSYLKLHQKVASVMWAGRRLWFEGPWQGVYQSLFPSSLVAVAGVWLSALTWSQDRPVWWWAAPACWALWILTAPLAVWAYLRFRQQHVRLGPLQLLWKVGLRDFWGAMASSVGWAGVVSVVLLGLSAMALGALLIVVRTAGLSLPSSRVGLAAVGVLAGLWLLLVWPHVQGQLVRLVWNKTGNRHLRFQSYLKVSSYVSLFAKNGLRLLLTGGLYWPWAVVNLRRMRTQTLQVWSRVEPEVLLAHWSPRQSEGAPEAVSPESVASVDFGKPPGLRTMAG